MFLATEWHIMADKNIVELSTAQLEKKRKKTLPKFPFFIPHFFFKIQFYYIIVFG